MSILLRPLISEKSMNLVTHGYFSFEVKNSASKREIGEIIKSKFRVDVVSVKIINIQPKLKTQRSRRGKFLKGGMKKAIIQLKKGQNIPLFETVKEEEVEVRTAEGEVLTTVKEKKSLFKGTKVRVEKASDKEKIVQETENRAPTKTSQKPIKKKGVK